ncbi:hypothetical protein G8C93_10120 [Cellulosimicrobium cellulans]|uniref:hypothetical protein n=1 Tax=Cellulosimicrobium cellulans TaxID=1710 RepID=UPI0018848E56|nr:hypothetical protein [Cellulosimicrobium cellulans]MBE9926241.1 hypothetical protein [Cellulosimicrobium cellulans]
MIDRRYSVAELRKMADDLDALIAGMEELEDCTGVFHGGPVGRWRGALAGRQEEYDSVTRELATLAGTAQIGAVLTNSFIQVSGMSRPLNPVAAWQNCTQPKALLGSEDILGAARAAAALLRNEAGPRERGERSLAGRVASIIRWPSRVREHAGFPADSRAARVTQWSIGAVPFALVTGIVCSALWAMVAGVIGFGS